MNLDALHYLLSNLTTKPQQSRQYSTGITGTNKQINVTKQGPETISGIHSQFILINATKLIIKEIKVLSTVVGLGWGGEIVSSLNPSTLYLIVLPTVNLPQLINLNVKTKIVKPTQTYTLQYPEQTKISSRGNKATKQKRKLW